MESPCIPTQILPTCRQQRLDLIIGAEARQRFRDIYVQRIDAESSLKCAGRTVVRTGAHRKRIRARSRPAIVRLACRENSRKGQHETQRQQLPPLHGVTHGLTNKVGTPIGNPLSHCGRRNGIAAEC